MADEVAVSDSKLPIPKIEEKIKTPPKNDVAPDPKKEQPSQALEEPPLSSQRINHDNPNLISSVDSCQQRKGSSRKKIQDFINTHKSRAAQSSRRAKSSHRNSNDNPSTPSDKGVGSSGDSKHSPRGSSSSSKRRLSFLKKSAKQQKSTKQQTSSKRNRAFRQQVSMEKPISAQPIPPMEEERPLQQMGVSHVVVKTKLDHKQLEASMRKKNKWYRFWSIVCAMITAFIFIALMSINAYGIHKIWQIYILYGKEIESNALIEKEWKFREEACLNTNEKSLMSRKGRLKEELSRCKRNFVSIEDLTWTNWSDCRNGKKYRHRKIEYGQEAFALNFDSFAQFENCI